MRFRNAFVSRDIPVLTCESMGQLIFGFMAFLSSQADNYDLGFPLSRIILPFRTTSQSRRNHPFTCEQQWLFKTQPRAVDANDPSNPFD